LHRNVTEGAPGDPIQGGDTLMKINIFAAEFRRTVDKGLPEKAERVRVVGR